MEFCDRRVDRHSVEIDYPFISYVLLIFRELKCVIKKFAAFPEIFQKFNIFLSKIDLIDSLFLHH